MGKAPARGAREYPHADQEDSMIEQMIGKRTASQLTVAVRTITVALVVIALALVVIAVTAVIGVV
jgi:hypothetical protein